MLALVYCLAALLVASVRGRPDGSTTEACLHMIPQHSYIEAQKTEFPYELLVDERKPYVDQKLTFTILSKTNQSLVSGFLVQAREVEFISNPFGVFIPQGPVRVMDCLGGFNNTATHIEPSPKESVSMVWYPPPGFKQKFRFYATVAKTREIFWVAQPSEIIEYVDMPV